MTTGIEDLYPLSPAQQGLLFHSLRTESAVYVEQQVYVFSGEIDTGAWERAWQAVLARHPALRTSFLWDDLDAPLQVVHRRVELPLERYDWRGLAEAERDRRLKELIQTDRERGFDLRRAPLLRQVLITAADRLHYLVWAFHHLVLDGWSRALVLRDWQAAYESCRRGGEPALAPAPPYRDFIAWLQQRDLGAAECFWRHELRDVSRTTPLPLPAGRGDGWGVEEARLSAAATEALRDLARRERLTLNTLAQGGWALLLSRLSGEEDVVFGATVSGRPAELAGIEETAGLFLNTLPVRARVVGSEPLLPWLRDLQERQLEARSHEHAPLVQVQGWSEIPRGLPLFESVLVFENYPRPAQPGDGTAPGETLRADLHPESGIGHTNYPLALVVGTGPELGLRVSHDLRRFAPDAIHRMLVHLRRLLEELTAHPGRTLSEIPWLAPAERRQLLEEWSGARVLAGDGETFVPVHREVADQARRTPERVALVCGESSLTYAELHRAAGRLARHLRNLGVGPEVAVAVAAERQMWTPVAMLAVLAAGGVYVPLDPAQPDDRLSRLLADADPTVLISGSSAGDRLAGLMSRPPVMVHPEDAQGESGGEELDSATAPGDAAYLLYTSGTTGKPKGVVVEHRHLARTLRACRGFGWSESDRVLCLAPLTFDISLFELLNPLLTGGAAVLLRREEVLDLGRLTAAAETATVLHAVPALLGQLVAQLAREERPLPRLRALFTGGDAVPADLLAKARRVFPAADLYVLYGPTEGTIICAAHRVPEKGEISTLPIGRPLPGAVLRVIDRWGQPVPVGVPGEILVGGGGTARGYHLLPELTSERFVEVEGSRFYRTGDLARWTADGELQFAGRVDQQVKIRGFRVEPREIEAALARHPAVREAVVIARESPAGRDRRLVAYVTLAPEASVTPEELRRFASALLPNFMVPSAVVVLESFPITVHGKVDRAALPEPERPAAGTPPRTAEEEKMAAIWREVLGLASVGVEDDFFALGGHSLLATQVLSRVRAAFGIQLTLRALFDAPTLEGMAAVVRAALAASHGPEPAAAAPPAMVRLSRDAHRARRASLDREG